MKKINFTFIITFSLLLSACSNSVDETNNYVPTVESGQTVESGRAKLSQNGKEIEMRLIGGAELNLGNERLEKGKNITFSLVSDEEREIEIGIISISTEEIYSNIVKNGNGIVDIIVPYNDDYSIYVKNNDSDTANLNIKLNIKLAKID
ncbi:hypothetical protein [Lysinibacillus sp. NPDC093688]|uniref:hypothetical protein n=1 Tax=Lysinibacillus sp. NPDC093688 TaxID=3390577 RepID=UPI003CFE83D5